MTRWTAARCKLCGWAAKRMLTIEAQKRKCPYCKESGLVPV